MDDQTRKYEDGIVRTSVEENSSGEIFESFFFVNYKTQHNT